MSKENWTQHCSHTKHKLKEVYSNCKFKCHICKDESEGTRYKCEPCNFNVHTTCGTLPESLSSFTHPQHSLSLKPKPFLFHKCRLCREFVTGMVYRCEADCCKFSLHPTCSLIPELWDNHPNHRPHPLNLRSLDDSKKLCDICKKKCKSWRYHCEVCDVHIHVKCLVRPTEKETTKTDHEGKTWTYIGRLADLMQIGG